jgi:hypothetical protein
MKLLEVIVAHNFIGENARSPPISISEICFSHKSVNFSIIFKAKNIVELPYWLCDSLKLIVQVCFQ